MLIYWISLSPWKLWFVLEKSLKSPCLSEVVRTMSEVLEWKRVFLINIKLVKGNVSLLTCSFCLQSQSLFATKLRACLHGAGGPQVGEVTRLGGVNRLGLPHLSGVLHLHVNRPFSYLWNYSVSYKITALCQRSVISTVNNKNELTKL